MAEKKAATTFIKNKGKPGATLGFRTSDFFRSRNFKPGGVRAGFNPGSFTPKARVRLTQHKG